MSAPVATATPGMLALKLAADVARVSTLTMCGTHLLNKWDKSSKCEESTEDKLQPQDKKQVVIKRKVKDMYKKALVRLGLSENCKFEELEIQKLILAKVYNPEVSIIKLVKVLRGDDE
ncbi:hypothetical protein FGO68_gene15781 [Halteria grandinella]|uniref:Uncharacterized protein n=1 Tax=Halteria grandinella TaxID=5974 RepID=A0A8J8NLH1_HALGN|nr:hypothetical protein FGO68_gene15781 [Halteria grandinella]